MSVKVHSDVYYDWIVVPFELTNVPAVFSEMINRIFRPYLNVFVIVYLQDILGSRRVNKSTKISWSWYLRC